MSINKKHVMAGMLASAMVIPLAGATDSFANETRTTTANVNFRTGPSTTYKSISVLKKGTTVTYLETSGDWTKVQYNSQTGYINSPYLSAGSSDSGSTSTTVRYVNSSIGLNVRKGASTSYAKVATLAHGTKVEVITTSGGWSKITSGNITGYVSTTYLTSTPSNNVGDSNDDNNQTTTSVKYVKSGAGLNVRKGPSTGYAKVTTLAAGTEVTVHSTSNGWSKITSGSVSGYVSSAYLTDEKPSTPSTPENDNSGSQTQTTKYINATVGLNVRSGAGTSYSKVATLAHGTEVTVHSTSNGWSKITSGSVSGYVSSSYLTDTKPSVPSTPDDNTSVTDKASKVIAYGKQQLGKPYVWGAQGPSSFDCSGFTYYIFKNSLGISLPRTSSMQSGYGQSVSRNNLQAGDLVFFDTVGGNNGVVSHVGMYIGGGQLLHASSGKGKVVIDNMNSSYYQNAFVNARRVL